MMPVVKNTTPVANNASLIAAEPAEEDIVEEEVIEEYDEFIDEVPPLFSFGDQQLFKEKLEERGIEGVTQDIVSIVQPMLPQFSFTYESLKDGSADVLEAINPQGEVPELNRGMTDEAILALFTDLEDYGKYDPPTAVLNADGSPQLASSGKPMYSMPRYNTRAMAGGLRNNATNAAFTTIGGWYGARATATAYLATAQKFSNTGIRPYDVVAKTGAVLAGAIVGSQILNSAADTVNEFLFDEPEPIVVPSLQAAYNSGETLAYGISFLATPWVGVKMRTRDLGEMFNAQKTLENFRTIASKKFDPDTLVRLFGDDMVEKAAQLAAKQAGKGRIRTVLTPNQEKGPTALRLTDTIFRGGAEALKNGKKNPKTWLGIEGLLATSAKRFFRAVKGLALEWSFYRPQRLF